MTRSYTPACLLVLLAGSALAASAPVAQSVPEPWVEFNGIRYHVDKQPTSTSPGGVQHRYWDGLRWFTFEELEGHVAAQPPRKITPFLETVLAKHPAGEPVSIFIVLRHQPAEPIARQVWDRIEQEREALASGMRAITRRTLERPSMPEALERDFIPLPLTRAELEQRRLLAEALDDLERDARQEIHARIAQAIAPSQNEVAVRILELGGQVTARVTAMNVLGASLTPAAIRALADSPLVAQIDFDHPGEPELDISRLALQVHTGFWANNITGGVFDAGVLDTGVQMNHPALTTHPFLTNMNPPGTDTGDHGTHVAGIMVSTDPTHRGMAYGANRIIYALAGSITTSMPGMDFIASTGEADVCNYSFGNGTASTNDYTPTDQFFDGVISTFSYLVSKSTGNGGFGTGNPTITHPAPAYNLLACANINDANTATRNDDWISSSSSRGPTAGGRKKPDIGAPGTNILSANKAWATGAHFISKTGTSMAAPHVGGAVLLLYDMGVNNTRAAKAVLINTADAIEDNSTSGTADDYRVDGSRWNRRYGWGYMHLGKAYLNGLDFFADSVRTTTPRERFRLYSGEMFQHEKATLVWQRHVAYNGATYPNQVSSFLSDLDLFAYSEPSGGLLASSTSAIDNVEQLSVNTGGIAVLKVKAVGNFPAGVQQEHFALATQENFVAREGPAFDIEIVRPGSVLPGAQFIIRANVTNAGDLRAHNVMVNLVGASIVSGTNPVNIGGMAASGAGFAEWTVTASSTAGSHPVTINITSISYGENFTGQQQGNYLVSACYPDCDNNGFLNVEDFSCFIDQYAAALQLPHAQQVTHYANCDNSLTAPVLNVEDFSCFINKFATGCP
jgi:serine protease AprX